MIRLVLSDLVAHARVWLGTLAVTIASGFVAAIAAGLIETGAVHGGRVQEGLASTSAAVITFTAVTALIVLSSTANLTVALQQRSYALWQIVGIRPALVGLVVLAQLGIVGFVGALIGCLIAIPVFGPLFTWTFRTWETMQDIALHLGIVSVFVVSGAITAAGLLGGLRGARRASRTLPIEALRDPEPPRVTMGWLRLLLTAGALAGTVGLSASLNGAPFTRLASQAILLTPLIAAAFAAAGPILFPLALRAWTSLLPAKASASWFLARNSARYRLSQSSAAVGPLLVAVALAGGLYTTGATLAAAQAIRTGSSHGFRPGTRRRRDPARRPAAALSDRRRSDRVHVRSRPRTRVRPAPGGRFAARHHPPDRPLGGHDLHGHRSGPRHPRHGHRRNDRRHRTRPAAARRLLRNGRGHRGRRLRAHPRRDRRSHPRGAEAGDTPHVRRRLGVAQCYLYIDSVVPWSLFLA